MTPTSGAAGQTAADRQSQKAVRTGRTKWSEIVDNL